MHYGNEILSALGIPASNAINMFYKQIILHKGLPFEVKLPTEKPAAMGVLIKEELDAELDKDYTGMLEGRTKPAGRVFAEICKDYGL